MVSSIFSHESCAVPFLLISPSGFVTSLSRDYLRPQDIDRAFI